MIAVSIHQKKIDKSCTYSLVYVTEANIYLLTYMGVFGLVQTRGFCSDGVIRPLDICVPLLLLLKGKVITSSFFNMCLPLGVGVKNVKGIEA